MHMTEAQRVTAEPSAGGLLDAVFFGTDNNANGALRDFTSRGEPRVKRGHEDGMWR